MTLTTIRPARPDPAPAPAPDIDGAPRPRRGSLQRTAILVLVAAVIFQPILHPSGPGNSSPVDILILASIVTAAIWATTCRPRLRAPYFLPVAVMLAAGAASGLVGPLPGTSLLALADDVLLFALCTAVVNVLSAPRAMRCALVAWSWSGIFWAAVVVVAWAGHITPLEGLQAAEGNRVLFTFGDPNYASTYWDATIFVVFAARTPAARWARIIGYALLVWALVLTESNGGAVALLAGVAFLLLVRAYRSRGWAGATATALVIGLAVGAFFTAVPLNSIRQWAANSNQPVLVNSIGRSAQSSSERGELITESRELYEQSDGVIGLGPASTKPLLTTELYPYANEAHDDYLAALVERGAAGLLGLLLLVGSAIARASPVVRGRLSPGFAAAVPVPSGLVAALLALSVNSLYEEILHFRFLWILLGIVAVLGRDVVTNRRAGRAGGAGAAAAPSRGR
jgi:O-Antigen ligase